MGWTVSRRPDQSSSLTRSKHTIADTQSSDHPTTLDLTPPSLRDDRLEDPQTLLGPTRRIRVHAQATAAASDPPPCSADENNQTMSVRPLILSDQ